MTTFGLPDLRGRVAIGAGQGPGLQNYDLGQVGGTEQVALTLPQLPQHQHQAALPASSDPGTVADPTGHYLAAPASSIPSFVTSGTDGALVGTRPLAGLDRIDLVCMMLGKSRDELRVGTTGFHEKEVAATDGPPLLRVDSVARRPKLSGVTVEVRKGEIVGLAGLLGSGRTETARIIFGVDPAESGSVYRGADKLDPKSPTDAISAGFAFLSEDRKAEGIIPELSVRENLTLAALPTLTRFGCER